MGSFRVGVFFGVFLAAVLFSALSVEAAVVQGTVYTLYLEVAENAVVRVNSLPEQVMVARDGSYSFDLPKGEYVFEVTYADDGEDKFYAKQDVEIEEEGSYNIDIIMLPVLEEGDDVLEEVEKSTEVGLGRVTKAGLYATLLIIGLFIVYLIAFKRHFVRHGQETEEKAGEVEKVEKIEKTEEEKYEDLKSETEEKLEKVIEFIRTEGGRVTQKDIRKKFPLSEAKISLMITELEDKGIVKKIKKGRGNVIILKR